MANSSSVPVKDWIMVPALITLLVTILRLVGELMEWSSALFGRTAGGGGALIGIVWLVPVFGIFFGWKLVKGDYPVPGVGKVIGLYLLILLLAIGVMFAASWLAPDTFQPASVATLVLVAIICAAAVYLAQKPWPELGSLLFKYALAARIPVVIIMLIAIYGDWGTHYDVVPDPSFPAYGPFMKWVIIGLVPQLTVWVAFTMLFGGIFAAATAALVKQK